MTILKETLSFCPECYKEIPATVHEETDGIYIRKECEGHGKWNTLVETNKKYYKTTMQKDFVRRDPAFVSLFIPVTHACNLRCFFCYAPNRAVSNDHTPEQVEKVIREYRGEHILFTGGEPTLCKTLPKYLQLAKECGIKHALATNGIKLEDRKYFKSLRDAGLEEITLPIYGFDDSVYKAMTGRELVESRRKAWKNIRQSEIPISISYTIVRGVNEHEFPQLLEMVVENADQVYQLRIRSASPAGALTESRPLFATEYISLFAKTFEVDPLEMIDIYLTSGPNMEFSFAPHHNVPKNPLHFEMDLVKFLRQQAAKGNTRCARLLKLLPTRNSDAPDIRNRPEFLFINSWNWASLEALDLMDFRNIPLGYLTYNRGIMGFPEATALSNRLVEM